MEKDYKEFCDRIKRSSNKATCHVTTVGGCSGSANIARMWKDHFEVSITLLMLIRLVISFVIVANCN